MSHDNDIVKENVMGKLPPNKTRRGQMIRNKLKKFTVMYQNIRGAKSKYNSLLDKVEEIGPTLICLTETHLLDIEKFPIEGYEDPYRHDRDNLGGGILIGIKKELKNICTVVEKSSEVGEMMWLVLDNNRIKLRIGVIYAPQESRTTKEQLKLMYEKIGEQISLAREKKQKVLMLGDFNCKIGEKIIGNRTDVTKGGKMLLKLVDRNRLTILNSNEKCHGLWTRVENGNKSVLDYVIVDEESNPALCSMNIDEKREFSPIGYDKQGNPVQSDHNVIVCNFNWLIDEDRLREHERKTITEKGWARIRKEMEETQISAVLSTGNSQEKYTEWKKWSMM